MWETRRVFHIPTRFSFFASFFLFARPPFFVDNSLNLNRYNQRFFLLPFSRIFLPPLFQYIALLMRLVWRQVVAASIRPYFIVCFNAAINFLIGLLKVN